MEWSQFIKLKTQGGCHVAPKWSVTDQNDSNDDSGGRRCQEKRVATRSPLHEMAGVDKIDPPSNEDRHLQVSVRTTT